MISHIRASLTVFGGWSSFFRRSEYSQRLSSNHIERFSTGNFTSQPDKILIFIPVKIGLRPYLLFYRPIGDVPAICTSRHSGGCRRLFVFEPQQYLCAIDCHSSVALSQIQLRFRRLQRWNPVDSIERHIIDNQELQ